MMAPFFPEAGHPKYKVAKDKSTAFLYKASFWLPYKLRLSMGLYITASNSRW